MCDGWTGLTLSEVITLQRGFDLPLQDRRPGRVPILGSFGVTGRHDVAPVEGPGVTIGRSGASIGIATYTESDYWPLNTTLFVRDFHGNEPRFVYYLLKTIDFTAYNSGSAQPSLNRNYIARIPVKLPPRIEQNAIAEVLGALDDKIDANSGIRRASRHLGLALFDEALERAGSEVTVGDLAKSLTRGVAPKYTDPGHGVLVLNQKCIRDGWASIEAARWMQDLAVSDARKAQRNDVVVNSTGVGTLGRVARWLGHDSIAVDGHVSVVRPDAGRYSPIVFGYAMLAAQPHIEALGEGSTGQTELSRDRLASLRIAVPTASEASRIATPLEMLDDHAESLLRESKALRTLRDALLPRLLSGEIRVREVEELLGKIK